MVPEPAHNGCEGWLNSMWAVGRHLSQYVSAVDAFAAPGSAGTCKHMTHIDKWYATTSNLSLGSLSSACRASRC